MTQSASQVAAHPRSPKDRSTLYDEITNKIVAELEAGRSPLLQ